MANYLVTDEQLQAIANKIRSKTGGSAGLEFYEDFITEIDKLTDTRDGDAVAGDVVNGKKCYVNKALVTGNIPVRTSNDVYFYIIGTNIEVDVPAGYYSSTVSKTLGAVKDEATYNTSSSDQEIAANQFLTGKQTIKAVTTSNIDAGNIKKGVVVKVGDANSSGRIKNVTGTYTGFERISTSTKYIPLDPDLFPSGKAAVSGTAVDLTFKIAKTDLYNNSNYDFICFSADNCRLAYGNNTLSEYYKMAITDISLGQDNYYTITGTGYGVSGVQKLVDSLYMTMYLFKKI